MSHRTCIPSNSLIRTFFQAWFYDNSEYTMALMIVLSLLCNGLRFTVDLWYTISSQQNMSPIEVSRID